MDCGVNMAAGFSVILGRIEMVRHRIIEFSMSPRLKDFLLPVMMC